jgi:hypothetical protein
MPRIRTLWIIALALFILSGCADDKAGGDAGNEGANGTDKEQPDAVTTASLVNDEERFLQAIGENGSWIVAILNDLKVDGEAVVAGTFHDKNDPNNEVYRKLALYAQDADRNITASYTLTVPKLVVRSENFRIQGGTVKGDVFVEAKGFNLHETATIDGNLFFADEDIKASASIDGKVTGTTDVGGG